MKYIDDNGFNLVQIKNGNITLDVNLDRGLIFKSLRYKDRELMYIDEVNYKENERPRCGCPVLFPYSGNNKDNKLYINGSEYETSIHGLVHTNKWELVSLFDESFTAKTSATTFSRNSYPFDFQLFASIKLTGNQVEYEMKVINESDTVMPCDCGFHPFFKISNLDLVDITVDGKSKDINLDMVKESGQMFECAKTVEVTDNNLKLEVEMKDGLKNVLLWSGKPDKFIVIEPLSSKPNAINDHLNMFNLNPNETETVKWVIRLTE